MPTVENYTVSWEFVERARRALGGFVSQFGPENAATQASVLVPVFFKSGVPHLLLTKRSSHLRRHKGEVAFPGGRRDPDETPVETALRETAEEIGLSRESVEILGALDTFNTNTGYQVTPIVGLIPYPAEFRVNPHEIERLIEVPLPVIARPEAREVREFEVMGRKRPIFFYHYADRDPIWGASGYIVHRFLLTVYPLLMDDLRSEAAF